MVTFPNWVVLTAIRAFQVDHTNNPEMLGSFGSSQITKTDRMVLPYTIMPGIVMTVWVFMWLLTDRYSYGQGGIVDAVLRLLCEIGRNGSPAYGMHRVCPLLQASARARMYGDEATPDGIVVWCRCCCGLWLHARTHNPLLGR